MTGPAALARLLLGAACISTAAPLASASGLPASVSAFWRMALAAIVLLGLLRLTRRWRPVAARDWAWLALPAVAFAADLWFWHRSIAAIGPGLSTLLANFQVFALALAGWLLYRERLTARYLGGLVLAAVGLWLLLGRGWHETTAGYRGGVWFGLATAVAYAVYLLVFRHVRRFGVAVPAVQSLAMITLLCVPMLAIATGIEGRSLAIDSVRALLAVLALAILAQCLGWWLIAEAMPRLSASVVGLGLLLQPLLAFIQDVLLFARATSHSDWLGLALALVGIFLGATGIARTDPNASATPDRGRA